MIDQKFRAVFQISPLANIPQKWFSTQNGPLDVRSQMRRTQLWRLLISGEIRQKPWRNLFETL